MAYTTKEEALQNIGKVDFSSPEFDNFRDDKEVVMASLKTKYFSDAFNYASERLRDDKEVVLEAVKQDGHSLQYASDRLKNDEEVVSLAIENYGFLVDASERLRTNREFVMAAVKAMGHNLSFLSEEFRNDREIVLEAVKTCDMKSLKLNKRFYDDKEVIINALPLYSADLHGVSDRLKDDPEVVLVAVKHLKNPMFGFVSVASQRLQELCKDKDPVVALMEEIKRVEAEKLGNELSEKDSIHSSKKIKV